jgi:hypothetical protein
MRCAWGALALARKRVNDVVDTRHNRTLRPTRDYKFRTTGATMSKFIDALEAGAKAAAGAPGPGVYETGGRKVRCTHCGGTEFTPRHLGEIEGMRALPFETTVLICIGCSHIELIAEMPMRV